MMQQMNQLQLTGEITQKPIKIDGVVFIHIQQKETGLELLVTAAKNKVPTELKIGDIIMVSGKLFFDKEDETLVCGANTILPVITDFSVSEPLSNGERKLLQKIKESTLEDDEIVVPSQVVVPNQVEKDIKPQVEMVEVPQSTVEIEEPAIEEDVEIKEEIVEETKTKPLGILNMSQEPKVEKPSTFENSKTQSQPKVEPSSSETKRESRFSVSDFEFE